MSSFQRYADLVVGDRYPAQPQRFEVSESVVRRFNAAVGEPTDGPVVAGTSLAGAYTREAVASLKGPPGGVHAKQRFKFHRAPRIGDLLTTILQIEQKYEKNGRRYVVSTLTTKDAGGDLVSEGLVTAVWGHES